MKPRRWAAGLALALPAVAGAQWRVVSPPAAAAWFAVLDSLGADGRGAFAFTKSAQPGRTALGRSLAHGDRHDILHFVPLYYPSASRGALADALTEAAGDAPPSTPRAQFLVGALRQTLPNPADRAVLRELAALLRRTSPPAIAPATLAAMQAYWDRRLAGPLAPFLHDERLDAGMLWILPPLGPEGRIFAGVAADRTDNIAAVGAARDAENGPLHAAVRELCFPLVSRVAEASAAFRRGVTSGDDAAHRTSVAAVRCGAELLDRVAPSEAGAYRTHWLSLASRDGPFDAAFPPDPALQAGIRAALARYGAAP